MSEAKNKQNTEPGWGEQIPKIWSMAFYSLRAQLRNPATFAFGFIFPIVFISVFGLISSSGGLSIKLGVADSVSKQTPISQALNRVQTIKVDRGEESALRTELLRGKLDGLITTTQGDYYDSRSPATIKLEVSNANPQQAGAVQSILSGVIDKMNLQASGVVDPPFKLTINQVAGREFRYIDFTLPGMIGFALLSTAIFNTAFGLIFLKKTLVLKRIFATPTKPLSIILGQGLARLISAVLQTVLILAFGVLVFKFHLASGWVTFFEMLLISSLGLIVFLGFGLFISGISSDENSVAPLANLITLPQFLLSGTFFSTEAFPKIVQPIANNLPLSYLNSAMRKVATEGATLAEIWPYLAGLLIWGIVAYLLAARTFKWQ